MSDSEQKISEQIDSGLYEKSYLTECELWEVDLYENWMKVKPPKHIMERGFHVGTVLIDFKGVQE